MSRLLKITSLLMVALWLPATLHCGLEHLGFEGLFGCPASLHEAEHAADQACVNDTCRSIESGQFLISTATVIPATPSTLANVFIHFLLSVVPPKVAVADFVCRQTVPLPLERTWQFTRRTALPARAPDVLNT
ncbi:MAG: hypothetical protein ABI273_17565 [Lacunisphaera sp.]